MRTEATGATKRRQHRVEIQARAIERVLARHGLAAEVRGGAAGSRLTTFVVEATGGPRDLRRPAIERRIAALLGASSVRLQWERGRLHLEVEDAPAPPVNLLDLLEHTEPWPHGVISLGKAEDGRPLYLNLLAPGAANVLLVGRPASGKSSLLRSIALSLAMTHRQSEMQMAFVDAGGGDLRPLHYLPHAIYGVVEQVDEIGQLIHFLGEELAYRRNRRISRPMIVTFVDGLSRLLTKGGACCHAGVGMLLRRGPDAGLYLILSTRDLPSREMSHTLRAHAPTRLVGRVADGRAALAASGVADSGADCLLNHGDFVAVRGETRTRFQAAFVDDYDLHHCLERLHRRRPPAIVARPFDVRPRMRPDEQVPDRIFRFAYDGGGLIGWE